MDNITFWKSKQARTIDPELFSTRAQKLAQDTEKAGRKIGKDGKEERNEKRELRYDKNRRSQIRKFYDEVQRFNTCAQSEDHDWGAILPMIHMITAKAAYAEGRNLISPDFKKFIHDSVFQIEDRDDLKVFADFFEAFMGFYRLYGPQN